MDLPGVPLPDERLVYSRLPAGMVLPGVPEATQVLCSGDGMALRALAIALAILSVVVIVRITYRVARSGPRSVADSMTSLLAATLPVVGYLWLSTQTTIVICS